MIVDECGTVRITGFQLEIYRNEYDGVVIKDINCYGEDTFIVIGHEQLPAVIKALQTFLPLGGE